MFERAGPELDREVARRVFGEDRPQAPPYSAENTAADLLLWSIAQAGIAFKVQELDGVYHCVLWRGSTALRQGATTESAPTRPLAICRAALRLCAKSPLMAPASSAARASSSQTRV
jgi:hypothetical protein